MVCPVHLDYLKTFDYFVNSDRVSQVQEVLEDVQYHLQGGRTERHVQRLGSTSL